MAKKLTSKKTVETLKHDEAKRKNEGLCGSGKTYKKCCGA